MYIGVIPHRQHLRGFPRPPAQKHTIIQLLPACMVCFLGMLSLSVCRISAEVRIVEANVVLKTSRIYCFTFIHTDTHTLIHTSCYDEVSPQRVWVQGKSWEQETSTASECDPKREWTSRVSAMNRATVCVCVCVYGSAGKDNGYQTKSHTTNQRNQILG